MNKNLDAALCEFFERVIPKDLPIDEKKELIKRFISLVNGKAVTYQEELEHQRVNGIYKNNAEIYGYDSVKKETQVEANDLPGIGGTSFKVFLERDWVGSEEGFSKDNTTGIVPFNYSAIDWQYLIHNALDKEEEPEKDEFDNLMEDFIQQPIGDVIYWLLKKWENE
jgi:hypothetical protein